MFRWEKHGVIFSADGQRPWMVSHACVPTALLLEDRIRLYIAPRNGDGKSLTTFIDLQRDNPSQVLYVHDEPILALGALGCFDDSGIMPGSIVRDGDRLLLYYVGWNVGGTVPYRNAIGVAESTDDGMTFRRLFPGPIIDRTPREPHFAVSPYVWREHDKWHLWYASGLRWLVVDGKPECTYCLMYGVSEDGIHWQRHAQVAIAPKHDREAIARPSVLRQGSTFHMWYAYRGSDDFRDGTDAYRIGYATCENVEQGLWRRRDAEVGIDFSPNGFDSSMQTYPCVLQVDDQLVMFYNGNGFGRTGVGYATAPGPI